MNLIMDVYILYITITKPILFLKKHKYEYLKIIFRYSINFITDLN